jgi:hypothetical protein
MSHACTFARRVTPAGCEGALAAAIHLQNHAKRVFKRLGAMMAAVVDQVQL